MESYIKEIESLEDVSFQKIRSVAKKYILQLPEATRCQLYQQLNRGVDLLDSHDLICQYMYSYGNMHEAKIRNAAHNLPENIFVNDFEIIDWGCGQGIGAICLLDHIKSLQLNVKVKKVTLIEPSEKALSRAKLHVLQYVNKTCNIVLLPNYLDEVKKEDVKNPDALPVVHIFSNILDIPEIDLKRLATLIDNNVSADNYIMSVGPLNPNNKRIDAFHNYYKVPAFFDYENSQFDYGGSSTCTYKAKVYKLEYNAEGNLIPIVFFPSVQFRASYLLDVIDDAFKNFYSKEKVHLLSAFEVNTPFDIGASVYDDVHPVLAALNNIITRGLPTKASPFVEEVFMKSFGYSEKILEYGSVIYQPVKTIDFEKIAPIIDYLNSKETEKITISEFDPVLMQMVFSPLAMARVQKAIIEALLTDKLQLSSDKWLILVEEKDVPCAALALEDLKQMFCNLTKLSQDYQDLCFPEIELHVISNELFKTSQLHLKQKVWVAAEASHKNVLYDLVIDISVFERPSITKESFSQFRVKNDCYFNIRSAKVLSKDRSIYTSDRIVYRALVTTDAQGSYNEIEETKKLLAYFLRLIFRKEDFREGQLAILDRALQNKNVIGLLPTGGGKSLTYQLATMLQPGVTLIVDPLRSLMKDQYDGLIKMGIDSCAFINSNLTKEERQNVENQMEQSRLQFVFLSPERLAIYSFRQKLKNMQELNVYFSYGVIDEVHCVSEWGHDFRFTYLHLGRNLYNYVKAKTGTVSLFGLTATASFDVLADVERELSGNGAFPLDSETIVRHENSNRLELQYKVEKVTIEFDNEFEAIKKSKFAYPDKLKSLEKKYKPLLDNGFSYPIKVSEKWAFFKAKNNFIENYINSLVKYFNDIQYADSVNHIKKRFEERQPTSNGLESIDLKTDITEDFICPKDYYDSAGIIFCPHKSNTDISVEAVKSALIYQNQAIGTFSGGDDATFGESSMRNLELFRDNKQPLMVATKAFGMGIDKPNVRFTINMNYSSSLESFVQEAGRAGRDRKMALSVILLSDYRLARINRKCTETRYPIGILKGKWFKPDELERIINHFNLNVEEEHINFLTPENDLVRLFCREGANPKYFAFKSCDDLGCRLYRRCQLRKVPPEAENWIYKEDLVEILETNTLQIDKKHIEYQNADFATVMYFYNSNFKGETIEKISMHQILNAMEIEIIWGDDVELREEKKYTVAGFLSTLLDASENEEIVSYINYGEIPEYNGITVDKDDIAKAIYRMTCIGLIEDFTQDYINKSYRIVTKKKKNGQYYEGLRTFLLRYYSKDRADEEIKKVYTVEVKKQTEDKLEAEIYQCLSYLTTFVYDKISVKRKRAIDDMRTFCIEGIRDEKSWREINEDLKDFIYYYFNSKYAKSDNYADNGELYSLLIDTKEGKESSKEILFKYLKVVDPAIEYGTPIDNVKHLQGAVRLLRRSLTDSNPSLSLLNAFCIFYLGTNNNENLEKEVIESYKEGVLGFADREKDLPAFFSLFHQYNDFIKPYAGIAIEKIKHEVVLRIHSNKLQNITHKYTV